MGRDLGLERGWRQRMREYGRSGLTIRQFCEQKGIVAHQFSWWRSELKRRDAKSTSMGKRASTQRSAQRTEPGKQSLAKTSQRFVPVEIQPALHSGASIEIILDQPPRLTVSSGFDADLLRAVVHVLERR